MTAMRVAGKEEGKGRKGRGFANKIGQFLFAPNIIFRDGSCIYVGYQTSKFPLPVTPLTAPVSVSILVP